MPISIASETTMMAISAIANFPVAQTWTSRVSYRSLVMPPSATAPRLARLLSSMFQDLLQMRRVERHERAFFQLPQEEGKPQAAQSDGNGDVHPAEGGIGEGRHDQPVKVYQPHQKNEYRD